MHTDSMSFNEFHFFDEFIVSISEICPTLLSDPRGRTKTAVFVRPARVCPGSDKFSEILTITQPSFVVKIYLARPFPTLALGKVVQFFMGYISSLFSA